MPTAIMVTPATKNTNPIREKPISTLLALRRSLSGWSGSIWWRSHGVKTDFVLVRVGVKGLR